VVNIFLIKFLLIVKENESKMLNLSKGKLKNSVSSRNGGKVLHSSVISSVEML
jgi:hypothetical protein